MKKRPSLKALLVPVVLGLGLALAGTARATVLPVPVLPSSYNADVIVEQGVPCLDTNTTGTVDGGTNNTGNTWFEIGYSTGGPGGGGAGVPHAGSLLTNVTDLANSVANPHIYQLAPSWTAPNGVMIDSGVLRTQAVCTISPGGPFTSLSFLVSSGNGGGTMNVKIYHADGSTETNTVTAGDWFNGPNPAFSARGRINVVSGGFDTQGSITTTGDGYGNPRWYSRDITLTHTTSAITNITLSYGTGGGNVHNQVFAISGSSGGSWTACTMTGYTDDFVVESNGVVSGPLLAVAGPDAGTNATTQSMDSDVNTGNSWYEQNFYAFPEYVKSGLPHAGGFLTNTTGDHIYQMAPSYEVSNAFYLNPSNLVDTVTLANPTNFLVLSFLNSSGNGPVPIDVAINHVDGTQENFSFNSLDWFNGGSSTVLGVSGRVDVGAASFNNVPVPYAAGQAPFVYANDIVLNDTNSFVTNIVFTYANTNFTGRTAIFAISGTQSITPPIIVQAPANTNVWPTNVPPATGSSTAAGLSAQISGFAPITYQWQVQNADGSWSNVKNGVNADGSSYSGATTANLTLSSPTTPGSLNYQIIASNTGGSATSTPPAVITILSPLPDIPNPGDAISIFNGSAPGNEDVTHAIDDLVGSDPGKYLNFGLNGGQPFLGPVGFTVPGPTAGTGNPVYSIIKAIRVYTANDTPGRDPADIELYGSINAGSTWTLISSNSLALSDNRNANASAPLDPINNVLQQVVLSNTNGYFSYRVEITHVKDDAGDNSMQVGEVELLGVVTNPPSPTITGLSNLVAYAGTNGIAYAATVGANGFTINSLQWQVQSNGQYVNLSDNANVSGSTTATLTLNNVPFGENLAGPSLPTMFNLQLVLTSNAGSVTSAPVTLTVISAATILTGPSDTIADFGNTPTPNNAATTPANAFDTTYATYISSGVGPSAPAGFAPFEGPTGLFDAPAISSNTVVTGVRFFTGTTAVIDDPADYTLEGSLNTGTNGPYTLISSGALSLPADRNTAGGAALVDPLSGFMQEVDFLNSTPYASYRITFHNVVNDASANELGLGELQLIGHLGGGTLSITVGTGANAGTITITSTQNGELQVNTNLLTDNWVNVTSVTAGTPITITPAPGVPVAFYRVVGQ